MSYSFNQLKAAVNECTSYDLLALQDDEGDDAWALVDPFGDQDGDLFYDLDDVADFVCNNDQVDEYLYLLKDAVDVA
jgi:hypothetical protein